MPDDDIETDDLGETGDEDNYLVDLTGEDMNDGDDEGNDGDDEDDEEETSRTYKLDLEAGRIMGIIDGLEAVEQAVRKAIATPRFDCLIYDDQYGSETAGNDMAAGATQEYMRTAVEGFIRDALSQDTRILEIGDFEIEFEDDNAYVSFSVSTIFGEIEFDKEVV